jgi:SNF2 family DNA or RNA helicase
MDLEGPGQERRARRAAREGGEYDSESDSDVEMRKAGYHWNDKSHKRQKQRKPDWIDQEGKDILPSAKTIAIKAQILNWIAEDENFKIIVFTQFINMIRVLQKVCAAEGWLYTLYHGGVSKALRQKNIERFEKEPRIRILLSSLKSGGIGLNLTMAQKVIVVDPWWNNSVEQQAFCRVFRIGQESETAMTRFVVEHTVDHNMIMMQDRKQEEIDQVMDSSKKSNLKWVRCERSMFETLTRIQQAEHS